MKATTLLTVAVATFALAGMATADVFISEIVDGTLPGGLPKFAELTNGGVGVEDLSNYSIANFNNGNTEMGGGASTVLSGMLEPCASYVIAYENEPLPGEISSFEDVYGFAPDLFIGPFWNGDDVIALFDGPATGDGSDATLLDVYGVIGVDGTGEVWEYTDSYSFRAAGVFNANPVFNAAEWVIAGPDALEGADDDEERQNLLDFTTPGTHPCDPVPVEDSTWGGVKAMYR